MGSTTASRLGRYVGAVVALASGLGGCNAPDAGAPRGERAAVRAPSQARGEVEGVELRVRCVRGEDGAPLAGAELFLLPPGRAGRLELLTARARGEDLESLARRAGTRVVCDPEGLCVARAEAPPEPDAAEGWLAVIGIAGGRLTLTELDATPEEQRLELHPLRALTVELRDDDGAPAAGLLVALRVHDEDGEPDDLFLARTGEQGLAVLRFPADLLAAPRIAAAAVGLFAEPVEVPLDARTSPDAPLLLRLPPYGSLELVAEGSRQPSVVFLEVLGANGRDIEDMPTVPAVLANGRARIEPVAPGLTIWAIGFDDEKPAGHWFAEGPGPSEPRRSARLELERYEETVPPDPPLVVRPLETGGRH